MSELEKELLEALEACHLQLIWYGDEREYTREALNKAWRAIVKAESRQKLRDIRRLCFPRIATLERRLRVMELAVMDLAGFQVVADDAIQRAEREIDSEQKELLK